MAESTLSEFRAGMRYLHAGIRAYYQTPQLWKYGLLPMGLILLFYLAVINVLIWLVAPLLTGLLPDATTWHAVWQWGIAAVRFLIYTILILSALLAGTLLLSSFYELLSSLFFDGMVARFEKIRYGLEHAPLTRRESLRCTMQSLRYSLANIALTLLLLIPGLLIPLAGSLCGALLMGSRVGLSYCFSSAYASRQGIRDVKRLASGHRALLLGFGVSAYLWLLIPFAGVVLLPGFAVAGAMLYRERLTAPGSD